MITQLIMIFNGNKQNFKLFLIEMQLVVFKIIQLFRYYMQSGLSALVFGGTGAVGKTLIPQLLQSSKWSRVLCVVRNKPEQWNKFLENKKLEIQIQKDLDRLFKVGDWKLPGFDAMFVCFGSQVKHGEQTFVKIDKTYPLLCADIAINNKIPHYLIVTSTGSDESSIFLYLKTKGEVERDLKLKKLNILSILKPGLIKNRPDARFGEKVAQFFSFIPFAAIQCVDLGLCLKGLAQTKFKEAEKCEGKIDIYENQDLLNFIREYKPKQYPEQKSK